MSTPTRDAPRTEACPICRSPHDRHEEDGHGGCVLCREYVPHTDDEYVIVSFPCPAFRLAEREAAEAPVDRDALAEALHTADVGCEWNPVAHATHDGNHKRQADAILAALPAPRAASLDVERLAQVLHAIQCADAGDDACYSEDGHLEDAERHAAEYARLAAQEPSK